MSFLDELLKGGPSHRASANLGGALIAPVDETVGALIRFQEIANQIIANDGTGYSVVKRLIHRSSDHAADYIDRMVIDIPR